MGLHRGGPAETGKHFFHGCPGRDLSLPLAPNAVSQSKQPAMGADLLGRRGEDVAEVILVSRANLAWIRQLCKLYFEHRECSGLNPAPQITCRRAARVVDDPSSARKCQGRTTIQLPRPWQSWGTCVSGRRYAVLNQRGPSRRFARAEEVDSAVNRPAQRDP